ncbi:unnamed protein product [Prunus brigantina]
MVCLKLAFRLPLGSSLPLFCSQSRQLLPINRFRHIKCKFVPPFLALSCSLNEGNMGIQFLHFKSFKFLGLSLKLDAFMVMGYAQITVFLFIRDHPGKLCAGKAWTFVTGLVREARVSFKC